MADFTQDREGLLGQDSLGAVPEEQQSPLQSTLSKLTHPVAVFFHFFFRTCAVLTYMLCNWFSDYFVLNFVIIVLLLSFDFWTVKNVSGRLLVGLRWWNHVKEDGTSQWVFESRKDTSLINGTESSLFWWSLYGYPVLWALFFIAALLGFRLAWLIIVVVALVLNGANVYGYTRCQKDAQQRLRSMAGSFLAQTMLSQAAAQFGGGSSSAAAGGAAGARR